MMNTPTPYRLTMDFPLDLKAAIEEFRTADNRESFTNSVRTLCILGLQHWRANKAQTTLPPPEAA